MLGEPAYEHIAVDGVAFIESKLLRGDRLLSSYKDGTAKLTGYLDDYAFVIAALIDVFEVSQQQHHLDLALALTDSTLRHFWDDSAGGFFFTSDDHERLIARAKPAFDGSIPSGNSVMARNLLRLFHYGERPHYLRHAESLLQLHAQAMMDQPFGMANMLCAADLFVDKPREIFVLGKRDAEDTRDLLRHIAAVHIPNRTLRVVEPGQEESLPDVMRGKKQLAGKATAYVCHAMTCSLPATSWSEVEPLLT